MYLLSDSKVKIDKVNTVSRQKYLYLYANLNVVFKTNYLSLTELLWLTVSYRHVLKLFLFTVRCIGFT